MLPACGQIQGVADSPLNKSQREKRRAQVEAALAELAVEFVPLSDVEAADVSQRWLERFAARVKKTKGEWVVNGYRWHGFSYGLEPALSGEQALAAYRKQWPAPFLVFDERATCGYRCEGVYPDLSDVRQDLYVAHKRMKWTMVFTHEQPAIGPFFAE